MIIPCVMPLRATITHERRPLAQDLSVEPLGARMIPRRAWWPLDSAEVAARWRSLAKLLKVCVPTSPWIFLSFFRFPCVLIFRSKQKKNVFRATPYWYPPTIKCGCGCGWESETRDASLPWIHGNAKRFYYVHPHSTPRCLTHAVI